MSYSFEKYLDLVGAVSNIPDNRGGTEGVYVPGTGEESDARNITGDDQPNIIHEAFVMYHRLIGAQVVDAFDSMINDMADGDPQGAVVNLCIQFRDIYLMAQEWACFTKEFDQVLSPGGC